MAKLISAFNPSAIYALNHQKKVTPAQRKQRREFAVPGTGDPEGHLPTDWFGLDELEEFCARCDVIVVCTPLTESTRGMMSTSAFNAMKSTAVIVNIARGEIIDQDALVVALKEKKIGGALLDVVTPEPLPDDSPLLSAPNMILTPHVSGFTTRYIQRVLDLLEINLTRLETNQPLINCVDRNLGY